MTASAVQHRRTRSPGQVDPRVTRGSLIPLTANLLQWYDASQIRGVADGGTIASLTDLSGNGNNLTGGGSTRVYRPYGISGRPAIEFNGGYFGGASRIVPLTEISIFLVLEYSGGRAIGLENSGSGSHGLAWYQKSLWIIRDSGATKDLSISGAPAKAIHSLILGSGGCAAKWNGATPVTGSGTQYSDASISFQLGSSGNPGGEVFIGKISEFASYSRKLTTTERDNIHADLNAKWGIY